ncbi:hypothetical protein RLJV_24135 [Pseudomonas aeruginosa]|nr:hypothetical protein RLJV_24135 [Pseudomonas aeruginosa]
MPLLSSEALASVRRAPETVPSAWLSSAPSTRRSMPARLARVPQAGGGEGEGAVAGNFPAGAVVHRAELAQQQRAGRGDQAAVAVDQRAA